MSKTSVSDCKKNASDDVAKLEKVANRLMHELIKCDCLSADSDIYTAAQQLQEIKAPDGPPKILIEALLYTVRLSQMEQDLPVAWEANHQAVEELVDRRSALLDKSRKLQKMLTQYGKDLAEYGKVFSHVWRNAKQAETAEHSEKWQLLFHVLNVVHMFLGLDVLAAGDLVSKPRLELWDDMRVYWADALYRSGKYEWKDLSSMLFFVEYHDAGTREGGERLMHKVNRAFRAKRKRELEAQCELDEALRRLESACTDEAICKSKLSAAELECRRIIASSVEELNHQLFEGHPLGSLCLRWAGYGPLGQITDAGVLDSPQVPSSAVEIVANLRALCEMVYEVDPHKKAEAFGGLGSMAALDKTKLYRYSEGNTSRIRCPVTHR